MRLGSMHRGYFDFLRQSTEIAFDFDPSKQINICKNQSMGSLFSTREIQLVNMGSVIEPHLTSELKYKAHGKSIRKTTDRDSRIGRR